MRVGDINLSEDQCGEFVCSFIAREGSWFPCALAKYHDGPHHSGGNCFTHGKYATRLPGVPPACPQCDESIKAMSLASIPASLKAEPVSYDPTLVQRRPTAPEGEQDVGRFVVSHLTSLHMPKVATDHEKRIEMGEKKYGQRLRTNNGRDWVLDCYQEALDGISYSAQGVLEGDDGEILHDFAILARKIRDKLTTSRRIP